MYSIIYRKISNWNIIIWKLNLPFKFQDLLKYFHYILSLFWGHAYGYSWVLQSKITPGGRAI